MPYPLPIRIQPGLVPIITQPFGATENTLEPEGPDGEPHFHYGVDIALGDTQVTYGAILALSLPSATIAGFLAPVDRGSYTPYLRLQFKPSADAVYHIVLAHCKEIDIKQSYTEGDELGLIGNYGLVSPQPTPEEPHAGAHLHLGVQFNGVWMDPLILFTAEQWMPYP